MNDKKVSIVIPTYNREKLIVKCIDSAIKQTYKNIEIIIVDNCSTDNTWKVLENYKKQDERIIISKNNENLGPVRNWEKAIKIATGEYIKILWSDDWIDEKFIEKTLPYFEDPEIAFVYTPTVIHSDSGSHFTNALGKGKKNKLEEFINSFCANVMGYPASPGNAIFRAEDIRNNLMIDIPNNYNLDFNRYGAGNDVLLFLKCFPKYKYFCVTKETLSHFLAHDDSFTSSNDLALYYSLAIKDFLLKLNMPEKENIFYHAFYGNDKVLEKSFNIKFSMFTYLNILIKRYFRLLICAYTWFFDKSWSKT